MAKKRRFIIDIDEQTQKKKIIYSDIILMIVFGLLLALIVYLSLTIFQKKDDPSNEHANLVIPVLEEKTNNSFSVDLSRLKDKEYIIKVTNFKNNIINTSPLEYTIEISNPSKVKIKLYKNEGSEAIATSSNDLSVKNNKLLPDTQQEDVYKILILETKNISSKDMITIKISS